MALFDSMIGEVKEKFNVNEDKAGGLLSTLLAVIFDKENGGFSGFLKLFNEASLGDTATSWVQTGANTPLSYEQTETVFGEGTLKEISDAAGMEYKTTTSATAFMVPHIVDNLTPDGEVPDDSSLLTTIGGYLSGLGGTVAGADEKFDAAAATIAESVKDVPTAVKTEVGSAFEVSPDTIVENGDNTSILKILIPLLLVALLAFIVYMSCGPAPTAPVTTNNKNSATNANTAENKPATNAATVDSNFTLKAENGKYIVSGVVPNEATKKQIMDALTAQSGEGNIDFAGLKVDANAKPFTAGWWDSFGKLLPNLKDWKTGTISFAGNALTKAEGLPDAAITQIKTLFGTGWTLPASMGGSETAEPERKLTEVSLPDGTKLQAYPGGIEDQLLKFIQSDEYKNGTDETLKDKWFNFDDLNFKFGSTELVPESKRQLDNIVAILKAFPDAKIKIGGYTDKKGDDAANKALSDKRAKAIKAALEQAGVGTQVPEAEGYGEEFATVDENASDREREADRKTAVRLIK